MKKSTDLQCSQENCDGYVLIRYLDPVSMDDKQRTLICSHKNCRGKLNFFLDDELYGSNIRASKRRKK